MMTTYTVSLRRELALYVEKKAMEKGTTPLAVIRDCIEQSMKREEKEGEEEEGEKDE